MRIACLLQVERLVWDFEDICHAWSLWNWVGVHLVYGNTFTNCRYRK
jgi:hypothetical protein